MLYYLTGMATERSAVLAYNLLHAGVLEMGEDAVAQTIIGPIRRQEPGALRLLPALRARPLGRARRPGSGGWSAGCASISFAPVGANNDAPEGRLRRRDGHPGHRPTTLDEFAEQIARVERELLWARDRGLKVPDYVARAFREAVELARARPHLPHLPR